MATTRCSPYQSPKVAGSPTRSQLMTIPTLIETEPSTSNVALAFSRGPEPPPSTNVRRLHHGIAPQSASRQRGPLLFEGTSGNVASTFKAVLARGMEAAASNLMIFSCAKGCAKLRRATALCDPFRQDIDHARVRSANLRYVRLGFQRMYERLLCVIM